MNRITAALLFLPSLLTSNLLNGQAGSGTISGSVFDPTGAAAAGATVMAQNVATGFRRGSAVTSSGEFSLIGLQPGEYTFSSRCRASRNPTPRT